MNALIKKIISAYCLGALLFFAWTNHVELKILRAETGQDPSVYYIPDSRIVKPLFLGHEALVADLVWIKTLGYFADELIAGKKPKYLEKLINFATDLDPRFEKLYIWAGAVFMYGSGAITKDKVEASNRILEKGWKYIQNDRLGWKHIEDYWLIPQMIGFNYAIELGDKKRGAPYVAMAGQIPGAPGLYKTWAATLYKSIGDMESATKVLESMLAIEVLEGQLQNVDGEDMKEKIRIRLNMYYEKLYGKEQAQIRSEALVKNIMRLRQIWQDKFPYLSFNFFLSLWDDEEPNAVVEN